MINKNKNLSIGHYLLVFIAGLSLTLAFAPINISIIAIIAPAALFYSLNTATTLKQHLGLNYLFALGLFGSGVSWVFNAMYFFSHAHIALALLFTLIYILVLSLVFLLQGLITYRFRLASLPIKILLLFPIAWVVGEAFRGWVFTGFPWLLLGHSHIDNFLSSIAPVLGTLGVSYLSILLSASLVILFIQSKSYRIVATLSISIVILSYGLSLVSWVSPTGESLKIVMIQGNIAQENKWRKAYLQPTLDLYMKKTQEHWDADVIIWPETAIAGYFSQHFDKVLNPLQQKSKETKTDLIIGGFYRNMKHKPATTENSILVINAERRDIYSKQHLVPFSEYVPLLKYMGWLKQWIDLPYDNVGKGTGPTNLLVQGHQARLSVCYEDAFGEEMIKGLPSAGLLINLSNDGWFTGSLEPYQHMQIARMRSLETGRYMLRSTNIGVSGIIDQRGKVIATAPAYQLAAISGEAKIYQGATPYVYLSNWPILGYSFLILMISTLRIKSAH
ncbi:MAG: apolipoprotein N-acyltransferase [Thiotrichaceae bacterium]|nr:apolipoprotein N-acyltransferase [Thiotrichaceae bacterium]